MAKRFAAPLAAVLVLAAGAAHADTMPQLDFGNKLLTAQVVWGAIIFAVFYGLVSRWGLPMVTAIVDKREHTIGDDLQRARLAKQKADSAMAEVNEARRVAFAESQAAINAAANKAKDEAAAATAEAAARLSHQMAESERQIESARAGAMAALRDVASDTALDIVARMTGRAPDHARLSAAVASELGRRGLAA